jgi:hypothetical protein
LLVAKKVTGTACADFQGAGAKARQAQDAYETCINKAASLLSVTEAKSALVALRSKYISKNFNYEASKAVLQKEFDAISDQIEASRKKLNEQYTADLASSTTKRDNEIARSKAVYAGIVKAQAGLVAAAQALRDAALATQTKEQALYKKLVDILTAKQGALDAALARQQTEGDAARDLNSREVGAASERYQTNSARILSIKESDADYLAEELTTVTTVREIVSELGITDEVTTK